MRMFLPMFGSIGVRRLLRQVASVAAALSTCIVITQMQPTYGQNISATILGTVRDSSGAVAANVTVTATNTGTSYSRHAVTDTAGTYTLPLLPVGDYTVTAEAQGFQKAVRSGVALELEQQARIDFVLSVGSVATTVTVKENAPVLDTDSTERTLTITPTEIVSLPLLGRTFTNLVRLSPGVVDYASGISNTLTSGFSNEANYSFGGLDQFENQIYLDGLTNVDIFLGQTAFEPSVDALQEFNVKANQYNAEFSGGGGIVNATFKSGTNKLHGSGFEFFRNSDLDARPFFAPVKSPYRYNQFGGVLGGPIVIPKIYNGHDRTFFFLNYEGVREHTPSDTYTRVPTDAERQGNFGALGYQLYDPVNLDPVTGQREPFANNIIPQARWNPYVPAIMKLWPGPNMPLNSRNQNYFISLNNINDADQFTTRVDRRQSDKWLIFGRYSWSRQDNFYPETYPGSGGNAPSVHTDQAVFGVTGSLSPTLLNEFRLGYTRRLELLSFSVPGGIDYAAQLGFPYASTLTPAFYGMPGISFNTSGINGFGSASYNPQGPNDSWNLNDTLAWIKGNHTFKVGFTGERITMRGQYAGLPSWGFTGLYTALIQGGQFATNGYDFADFLLGYPENTAFDNILPGVG